MRLHQALPYVGALAIHHDRFTPVAEAWLDPLRQFNIALSLLFSINPNEQTPKSPWIAPS